MNIVPNPLENMSTISLEISKTFLWGFLGVFFAIYALVSIILMYHWRRYGMKNSAIIFAEALFTFVSVGLFAVASISLGLI
jgi:hypothetical protein